MSDGTTASLIGAVGGAGTTRLTVELGALLANDGRDVVVLDAAFATQGLADYLPGRIDPDLTTLLTDERAAPLSAGLVDVPLDAESGRLACCPAAAPFERLARAKSPAAAQALESRIATAAETFDHVLVDTPPVAANQSVAAVNATARTVVVAPATTRGRDAIQRTTGRLDDLGVGSEAARTDGDAVDSVEHSSTGNRTGSGNSEKASRPPADGAVVDAVVTTRGELAVADAAVPETTADVTAAPTCLTDRSMATAVADVAGVVFDVVPSTADGHGLLDSVGDFVSR